MATQNNSEEIKMITMENVSKDLFNTYAREEIKLLINVLYGKTHSKYH